MHRENEIYLDFIKEYVVEVGSPQPGGIAMFKIGRNFAHAAIVTKNKTFIHAWGRTQHGSVIESSVKFFRHANGKQRDVKFLDVKRTWA